MEPSLSVINSSGSLRSDRWASSKTIAKAIPLSHIFSVMVLLRVASPPLLYSDYLRRLHRVQSHNPYFLDNAPLPGTITHGSSAAAR